SESQLAELAEVDASSLAEFRRVIGGALESILHTSLPSSIDVVAFHRAASPIRGARMDKLGLARRGTGEQVPAVLLTPHNYKGVVAVAVLDGGKAGLAGPEGDWRLEVRACLRRGVAILAPDVFLTGESLAARREKVRAAASGDLPAAAAAELLPVDAQRHGSYVGYTYGYNRTLIAQRVHDVLTAIAFARSLPGAKEVRLVGSGSRSGGVWALLARAVSGDAVGRTVVEADLDALSVESFQDENFLPGALKYGGLPFFAALCAPGELLILGSGEMPDVALAAYRAAGAEAKLRSLEPAAPALERMVDWICE
ncbi:MAG: hypothetical protein JXA90_11300, partial [Planctomycetes bacterium]|nr:hypothetical protein [Planctomycetota bacterium]